MLKEQRNIIAHDYAGAEMSAVFAFCRKHWAELEAICNRVISYAERVLAGRHHEAPKGVKGGGPRARSERKALGFIQGETFRSLILQPAKHAK